MKRRPINSTSGDDCFPPGTLQSLMTLTGLDTEQLTNILGMINGPEQSRSEWWLTADGELIYGYAEVLEYEEGLRGVTIGLYGATTGENSNDAKKLWRRYGHPEYGSLSPEDIIKKVREIAQDPAWWKAQWDCYIATYWRPVIQLLNRFSYQKALTIGALLDTAMNAGMGDEGSEHWGLTHLVEQAREETRTEKEFLKSFLKYRARYPTQLSANMAGRVAAWLFLWADAQWDMRIDLNQYCYKP